jgi:Transcription factor WhiB
VSTLAEPLVDQPAPELLPLTFDPSWAFSAACRTVGITHFFEDLSPERRGDPYARAREVCASCPRRVRLSCLATAIGEGLRTGFFAGCIPARRLELRKAAQLEGVVVSDPASLVPFLDTVI